MTFCTVLIGGDEVYPQFRRVGEFEMLREIVQRYEFMLISKGKTVGCLLVALLNAASLNAQTERELGTWNRLAGLAGQVMACKAPGQEKISDPVATARGLYEQAIIALDAAPSSGEQERMQRGASRATMVIRLDELIQHQGKWNTIYLEASRLHERHSLNKASDALGSAEARPPTCTLAFQTLISSIDRELGEVESVLKEGDEIMLRSRSSFDLKKAALLAQQSMAKFNSAREVNQDDQRPVLKAAEAKELFALVTSLAKRDIVIVSNPGDATLVVQGEAEDRVCSKSPCKFHFDDAFFNASGGNFIDSKRLLHPLVAKVSREGYFPIEVTLTKGPKTFRASVPGRKITQDYYYLSQTRFEVTLKPARVGVGADAGNK